MLSFVKFRNCKSHPVFCALSAIRTGDFSKEFLVAPVLYLCFAVRTGDFLNNVKLGILILITNMAQNDVIIRKTIKKQKTCEANPTGENSSLIFTVCVKAVSLYYFKLACVVLQMVVKEFFGTHF